MGDTRKVIKRNGNTVPYDTRKIYAAIEGANNDSGQEMSESAIGNVVMQINIKLQQKKDIPVECIQDLVEETLMDNKYFKTAKKFIIYRDLHNKRRLANKKLMESYSDLLFADAEGMDLKRDNANINTDAPMGIMLKLGAEGAKSYAKHYALPEKYAKMHTDNYVHIHDLDFSMITFNCLQQDLGKTLKHGFNTGHGFLREPNSIRSAASLACISIQSAQNDMYGGQSISALDFCLAPYVDKSFVKAVKHAANEWLKFNAQEEYPMDFSGMKYGMPINEARKIILDNLNSNYVRRAWDIDADRIYSVAMADVEEETKQAMEALVHNFNSLHSRAGGQVNKIRA